MRLGAAAAAPEPTDRTERGRNVDVAASVLKNAARFGFFFPRCCVAGLVLKMLLVATTTTTRQTIPTTHHLKQTNDITRAH